MKTTEPRKAPEFTKLLAEALTQSGKLSDCYKMFHNYSYGNQILAMAQLDQIEPINTYKGWQALGRQVKKGSKAIELCMPFTMKDKDDETKIFTVFGFRRNWFGLSQTEGEPYQMPEIEGLNLDNIKRNLEITEVPFEMVNGNTQGYSTGRNYAVNPVAKYPLKTTFHELAHIALGHTTSPVNDAGTLPRNIAEVEAESVAYLLSASFGLTDSLEESRGYIQHWNDTETISEATAKRIFKSATDILKANA